MIKIILFITMIEARSNRRNSPCRCHFEFVHRHQSPVCFIDLLLNLSSALHHKMIMLRAAKKTLHTAQKLLALSLAHGSVNSLLGPLAHRGVQGCAEINQQLTSRHLRSHFKSQNLGVSAAEIGMILSKPWLTLKWKSLTEKCRS